MTTVRSERRTVILAALAMTSAVFLFVVMDSLMRVVAREASVAVVVFLRNAVQFAALGIWALASDWTRFVITRHPLLQIARGLCLAGTTLFVVLSLTHLTLSQTYAIALSAPLLATALAGPALGERTRPLQWLFIAMGFAGVLIALDPSAPFLSLALLFPLALAGLNAVYQVLTRHTGRTDPMTALLFHASFWALVVSAIGALAFPGMPDLKGVGLLVISGLCGVVSHILLVWAFTNAPAAVVSPMTYSQIIWASGIGFLVFGEVPTLTTLVGGAIVAVSGVLLIAFSARGVRKRQDASS